jgi:ABC-type lipoprotein export system ATPase subunit
LVADEPTGSLDSHNGKEIMQLFQTLNAAGMTIVMVTHERDIADQAKRIITLHDGLIIA